MKNPIVQIQLNLLRATGNVVSQHLKKVQKIAKKVSSIEKSGLPKNKLTANDKKYQSLTAAKKELAQANLGLNLSKKLQKNAKSKMDKIVADTETKVSKYMANHKEKIESIHKSYSQNMKKMDSQIEELNSKLLKGKRVTKRMKSLMKKKIKAIKQTGKIIKKSAEVATTVIQNNLLNNIEFKTPSYKNILKTIKNLDKNSALSLINVIRNGSRTDMINSKNNLALSKKGFKVSKFL